MGIISFEFFIFCAAVILLYYLFPVKKYQWTILLAASWAYYLINCNKYILYLLVTIATTYFGSIFLEKYSKKRKTFFKEIKSELSKDEKKEYKSKTQTNKRLILAGVLVINFGILAFLKHFDYGSNLIHSFLGNLGVEYAQSRFNFVIPLGISFYTFQSMGYIIDVYRENVEAQKNFGKFALFVSFFPQIIQGPIGIYSNLANQLFESRKFNYEKFKSGLILICWGLFKKLIIADRAILEINYVTEQSEKFSGSFIVFTVLMYAAQLYADFSGGIDICRGIAETLGITMEENFKRPYFSVTLTEYWHRWHISLGNWLRNYLFYPLSLSKCFLKMGKKLKSHKLNHFGKIFPTALASLITFIIIGVWHGAETKYLAFGLWNGIVIMISSLLKPFTDKILQKLKVNVNSFPYKIFGMARTFIIVLIGYYFDIAKNFSLAMKMLYSSLFDFRLSDFSSFACIKDSSLDKFDYLVIFAACVVIFVVSLIQERTNKSIREILSSRKMPVQWIIYLALIIVTIVFGYYGPGTTPADFVYMQF